MKTPGAQRRNEARKVELKMTPMIDIVFNLVIFFLLMPSFEAKQGYLPTNLPSTQGQQRTTITKENRIRIDLLHVEPWNEETEDDVIIQLNQKQIANNGQLRQQLRQACRRLKSQLGDEKLTKFPVLISPDMVVWHKHVVAAFDAAIDAGFKNIQFTVPK